MSEYPQHEKMLVNHSTLLTIHDFAEWLIETRTVEFDINATLKQQLLREADRFAEQYVGIDPNELELEAARLEVEAEYPHGRNP